jgi:uncharacterized DUF497 family protein
MAFEWDAGKAKANLAKHGVSFEEASEAVEDPFAVEMYDVEHSTATEDRFHVVGVSSKGRLIVVVITRRDETVRIISARKATDGEAQDYAEARG